MTVSIAVASMLFLSGLVLGAFFPSFGNFAISTLKEWQELAGSLIAIIAAFFAAQPVWLQFRRTSLRERLSDLRNHKKEINYIEILSSESSINRIIKRHSEDRSQKSLPELRFKYKNELKHIRSYYTKSDSIRVELDKLITEFDGQYNNSIDEAKKKTKIRLKHLKIGIKENIKDIFQEEIPNSLSSNMKKVVSIAEKLDELLDNRIQNIISRIRESEGAD